MISNDLVDRQKLVEILWKEVDRADTYAGDELFANGIMKAIDVVNRIEAVKVDQNITLLVKPKKKQSKRFCRDCKYYCFEMDRMPSGQVGYVKGCRHEIRIKYYKTRRKPSDTACKLFEHKAGS